MLFPSTGYSIAFVGGTVFIIHALILLIAHLINATPPPILLFPRLELYLGLALMPVAGFLVGTSLAVSLSVARLRPNNMALIQGRFLWSL